MTMRAGKSMTLPPLSTACSNRMETEGRKTYFKAMASASHMFHYHLLPSWESVEVQIIFKSVMSFNKKRTKSHLFSLHQLSCKFIL